MKTASIILALLAAALAAGCADITVRDPQPSTAVHEPPPPVDTGQSAASLSAENSRLRASLARLEQDHRQAQAAVNSLERRKSALKRTREQVEDERDRYKKRADD